MEKLYNKLMEENLRIMKDSNEYTIYKDINVLDVLLFKISSLTMSLIINYDKSNYISVTDRFIIRGLLEELALYYYIVDGGDFKHNLLKHAIYQFEYPIYKKLNNDKMTNLSVMKENYLKSREVIKEELGINSDRFKNMFNRRLPFIEGIDNYNELINLKFGDLYSGIYGRLSGNTHFSINTKHKLVQGESEIMRKLVIELVDDLIEDKKIDVKQDYYLNKSEATKIDVFVELEKNITSKIIKHFKDDKSLIINILNEYYYILESLKNDYKYNLTEVLNIKIKPIFELFAMLDMYLNNRDKLYSDELIRACNSFLNKTTDLEDKEIKEAYSLYIKETKEGISKEDFVLKFSSQFGIIKDNKLDSYNKIIDYLILETKELNSIKNQEKIFRMMYDESILISHANGSLFFVNDGVFNDPAIYAIYPYIFIHILKKYSLRIKDDKLSVLLDEYCKLIKEKTKIINYYNELNNLENILLS